MSEITPLMVFFALLGGILPSIFWLFFWLREDDIHPEPRRLLVLAFLAGMLATVAAFPIEKFIADNVQGNDFILLSLWAITEETIKFIAVYIIAIRTKYFDEPIDAFIYFLTVALGFAALENTMFLFNPLGSGDAGATLLLGNFRFIGATLLHVAASGIIGIALAISFFDLRLKKYIFAGMGLLGAIILHTLFNFSIIITEGVYVFQIFAILWIFILGILVLVEKIKQLPPRSHIEYPYTGIVITVPNKLL